MFLEADLSLLPRAELESAIPTAMLTKLVCDVLAVRGSPKYVF